MALQLNLGKTVTIPVIRAVAAKTAPFTTLTVEQYLEQPARKILQVKFAELPYMLTVFQGAAYDTIASNWTDADVINAVKAMFP